MIITMTLLYWSSQDSWHFPVKTSLFLSCPPGSPGCGKVIDVAGGDKVPRKGGPGSEPAALIVGKTWWCSSHGSFRWGPQPWLFQWDFWWGQCLLITGTNPQKRLVGWTTKVWHLWPFILVITGYFNGIMHSVNGEINSMYINIL